MVAAVRAVAIVNGNARRLGGRLRRTLERTLPGGVRFTGSLDEARTTIRTGPTGREEPAGELLWQGTCTLFAGATIPFFGFGLKMFAFADARRDRFHLRCGDTGLFEILRNVPAAFRGEYFSEHVTDFLCDRVRVELDRETAIEAGGELLGRRDRVELALTAPITVVALDSQPR